jgi:hypothetical protein
MGDQDPQGCSALAVAWGLAQEPWLGSRTSTPPTFIARSEKPSDENDTAVRLWVLSAVVKS